MKKTQETKGITLISLVITIVVLLILAGVAISISVDDDGVFSKSGKAKNEWNANVVKEELSVGKVLDQLDNAKPTEVTVSDSFPEDWKTEGIAAVATADHRQAPIPEGFVASQVEGENTIAGGLVIYRKENGIMEVTDENHTQALKKCDQYVWIPVADINDMVMCKSNAAGSVCSLIQETNGDLKCTTHNSKDLAGRLYLGEEICEIIGDYEKIIYTMEIDYSKVDQTYNANSGDREPANLRMANVNHPTLGVTGGDASDKGIAAITEILKDEEKNYTGTITYDTIKDDWLALQQSDFDKMAKSVAKYKGFYISRYEVGEDGTSKKEQTVMTNATNDNMWWGLFHELRGDNTCMIWDCQYDQVVKFIGEEAKIAHLDRNLNVNSVASGSTPLDKMKNIYDLQSNFEEMTAGAQDTMNRIHRGESAYEVAFFPANYRGSLTACHNTGTASSRATLFIGI